MYGDGKPTAHIEFKSAQDVDDIDLDDEVTLMVRGKVKALRGPEQRKEEPLSGKGKSRNMTFPGCIDLENCEFKVVSASEWGQATERMEEDE
jgi:hypothetical protein